VNGIARLSWFLVHYERSQGRSDGCFKFKSSDQKGDDFAPTNQLIACETKHHHYSFIRAECVIQYIFCLDSQIIKKINEKRDNPKVKTTFCQRARFRIISGK
jgi:hypothetical protein